MWYRQNPTWLQIAARANVQAVRSLKITPIISLLSQNPMDEYVKNANTERNITVELSYIGNPVSAYRGLPRKHNQYLGCFVC